MTPPRCSNRWGWHQRRSAAGAIELGPSLSLAGAVRGQGEPHAGERQYMEVLPVRSEAGCESVADTNGTDEEGPARRRTSLFAVTPDHFAWL